MNVSPQEESAILFYRRRLGMRRFYDYEIRWLGRHWHASVRHFDEYKGTVSGITPGVLPLPKAAVPSIEAAIEHLSGLTE